MKSKKKSGLKILDFAICRTPVFNLQDKLDENWIKFTELIRDSSPAFYSAILSDDSQSLNVVDDKVKFSIWKYFNRARHRATPYGGFAAFSTINVSGGKPDQLIIDKGMITHGFIDWKEKESHSVKIDHLNLLEINSSIYKISNQYRYLRARDGIFEISLFDSFDELDHILKTYKTKVSKTTIHESMASNFGMNINEINGLLEQMIELQLVFSDLSPNITGEDYFIRIGITKNEIAPIYIISERKLISGNLSAPKLKDLEEAIHFLSSNLPQQVSNDLRDFRKAFSKKFEQKAVPLALVMDLETGIGYGNLGQQQQSNELVDFILAQKEIQQSGVKNIPFTQLHQFLLNQIIAGEAIKLEEFKQQEPLDTRPLPNTLSTLLHFSGENIVIESCGGCTANAMLGRFTIASAEIEQFGLLAANIEQQANPDVLFFDIAYQAEKQVDNVNRRKRLYKYELPILTWSCDEASIHFDDILVSVRNDEVVLWSKKYQKRMVPRIASAYNYGRSDLAVYRFLCDLQHQQIKSDLNFRLRDFFPGLVRYPRVAYKSVIVSPAMWLVPKELLKNGEEQQLRLINWLKDQQINFPIKAGDTDQTLCFDPQSAVDLDAFLIYAHQHTDTELYITEALISTDAVKDADGNDYAAQFVVSLSHNDNVYKACELPSHADNEEAAILPGGDWLYFEIYCHPYRADNLLQGIIKPFVKEHKADIQKWFFVRYQDPKPHIRLRLQLKDADNGYAIMNKLQSLLNDDFKSGLISDVQLKTYFKERERYGAMQMTLVEQLFCYDSHGILKLLSKSHSTQQLYTLTLSFMQGLLTLCMPEIDDQIALVRILADSFSNEFKVKPDGFKKLNQAYQEFRSGIGVVKPMALISAKYKKAFVDVMNSCESQGQQNKLLADLLHMRINRLFNSDQRTHELILYHYLLKMLVTQRACTMVQPV